MKQSQTIALQMLKNTLSVCFSRHTGVAITCCTELGQVALVMTYFLSLSTELNIAQIRARLEIVFANSGMEMSGTRSAMSNHNLPPHSLCVLHRPQIVISVK